MIRGMTRLHLLSADEAPEETARESDGVAPLRVLGFATALVGAVTLGLYIGRDPIANAEYGMGV